MTLHRIQTPDPGAALRRENRLVGEVAPSLSDTIVPVQLLADLTTERPAGPVRSWAGAAYIDPGPNVAGMHLRVPPGVIAQVRAITARSVSGFNFDLYMLFNETAGLANLTVTPNVGPTDPRLLGALSDPPFCTLEASSNSALASYQFFLTDGMQGSASLRYEPRDWFIYNPPGASGDRFFIMGPGTSQVFQGTVQWREWSVTGAVPRT